MTNLFIINATILHAETILNREYPELDVVMESDRNSGYRKLGISYNLTYVKDKKELDLLAQIVGINELKFPSDLEGRCLRVIVEENDNKSLEPMAIGYLNAGLFYIMNEDGTHYTKEKAMMKLMHK